MTSLSTKRKKPKNDSCRSGDAGLSAKILPRRRDFSTIERRSLAHLSRQRPVDRPPAAYPAERQYLHTAGNSGASAGTNCAAGSAEIVDRGLRWAAYHNQ